MVPLLPCSFPFARPRDRWGSFHFPQQLTFGEAVFPNGTKLGETDPVPTNIEDFPLEMSFPSPSGKQVPIVENLFVLIFTMVASVQTFCYRRSA